MGGKGGRAGGEVMGGVWGVGEVSVGIRGGGVGGATSCILSLDWNGLTGILWRWFGLGCKRLRRNGATRFLGTLLSSSMSIQLASKTITHTPNSLGAVCPNKSSNKVKIRTFFRFGIGNSAAGSHPYWAWGIRNSQCACSTPPQLQASWGSAVLPILVVLKLKLLPDIGQCRGDGKELQ